MLAGLAVQSLIVGQAATVAAFGAAAVVFVVLLVAASLTVASISAATLLPVRMTGPAVKRWSGFVLVAVGAWFVVIAFLPSPIFGA